MRAFSVIVMLAVLTGLAAPSVGAAPPGQNTPDLSVALLRADDLPAGWTADHAWDWQRDILLPDHAGNVTSLSMATGRALGDTAAAVQYTQRGRDGYIYRGVGHVVIVVPEGQGAAIMAVLRDAMRPGRFGIPEPEGSTNVWQFTATDPPALGDEAYALRVAVWDEVPGREPPARADGVYYAFRRGDAIVFFTHIEGAFPSRPLDATLTEKLTGVADQRLATLAGATLPSDGDGNRWLPWALVALAALALGAAAAALLVVRKGHRSRALHPA